MPGGLPERPATEATLTIFPERRGIMKRRATSWERKNMASMLSRITLSQASAG